MFDTVMDLFERQQWAACAEQATLALPAREWAKDRKAFLLLARSTSLRRLHLNMEAFEPARLTVYLAEEAGEADLLGRALANLAWVQHKIQGMEPMAVETQRRFLDLFPTYKGIRSQYLAAMLNLGVYLRAAGMYGEALDQFQATYRAAAERGDQKTAEVSRTYAVWEALRLRKVAEAEALIREGQQYLKRNPDPRLQAIGLLDMAQLAMLKNNPAEAGGHLLAAAPIIEQVQHEDPHLLSRALEIMSRVTERFKEPELALYTAILAKYKAEDDDRQDLADEAVEAIRRLALQYPDAVAKVMSTLEGCGSGQPNHGEAGL